MKKIKLQKMNLSEKIAKILLEKKAVKISHNPPFTWTSGIKSPIYCDNRLLNSFPDARKIVIEGFKQKIREKNLQFDVLAGTATSAISWAALLANEYDCPMIYVRSKPKGHGAGKQVEGTMEKGKKVLIIEDLFSTGGSSIVSAEACRREFDAEVSDVVAIFSYGFPMCKQNFREKNLNAYSLSNFETLVNLLEIPTEDKTKILEFSADPKNWWTTK